MRLTLWQAAWRESGELPADAEIATAKFWASEAGHRVAHTTVHIRAQLLTRMDRDGLIRRKPHPRDARSQTIALAPGTDAQLTEAHQHLTALDNRAVAGFTTEEIATLKHLLTRLATNLDRTRDTSTVADQ